MLEAIVLDGATVVLGWGRSAEVITDPEAAAADLEPAEWQRSGRLARAEDRRDFEAAHRLVRCCAARLAGVAAATVTISQRCDTCGGPHGRPLWPERPGVGLSLAHSAGVVAAAAVAGRPVGIDVERILPDPPGPAELAAVLHPAELTALLAAPDPPLAALRLWVRKEALVKAGAADLDRAARLDLSGLTPGGATTGRSVERFGPWTLLAWEAPDPAAVGCLAVGHS